MTDTTNKSTSRPKKKFWTVCMIIGLSLMLTSVLSAKYVSDRYKEKENRTIKFFPSSNKALLEKIDTFNRQTQSYGTNLAAITLVAQTAVGIIFFVVGLSKKRRN